MHFLRYERQPTKTLKLGRRSSCKHSAIKFSNNRTAPDTRACAAEWIRTHARESEDLIVVVPYFGSIAGAVPPTLFALTDSPGKALIVLGAYVLVQQIESNVTIPVVMAQRVRLHPAVVAIGVVVVGQLFGFVGLFVAVPILSLVVIAVEEFWVKPVEAQHAERKRSDIDLPESLEQELAPDEAEAKPLRPAS